MVANLLKKISVISATLQLIIRKYHHYPSNINSSLVERHN